jgi:hypothetical protein
MRKWFFLAADYNLGWHGMTWATIHCCNAFDPVHILVGKVAMRDKEQ